MSILVGLDIGGTKTVAAAADMDARIVSTLRQPTPIDRREGIELIHDMIRRVCSKERPSAIGVAVGGPLDWERGVVSPLHQPQWRDVPLRDILQSQWSCPCFIDVDTNVAAFGEYLTLPRPVDPLLYITISTGVGAGLIRNGAIYRGNNGAHPEFGHQAINSRCDHPDKISCECGANDCLEALVSGNGIKRIYGKPAERLSDHEWLEVSWNLGQGLRNAAIFYTPRHIILGGGISYKAGDKFISRATAVMERHLHLVPKPSVRLSIHGYDTALIGAIHLARESLFSSSQRLQRQR